MKIKRIFNWCEQYGIDSVEVHLTDNIATIFDSYKIKKQSHMIDVLNWLKEYDKPVTKQSTFIMLSEWRVHNLLYWMKIERKRTMHVDINLNSRWMKMAYAICSLFYFGQ